MSTATTISAMLLAAVVALPPLTEREQLQLADTSDYTPTVEGGGLYPLLRNALKWEADSEAGATVPDYGAILSEPGAHRGELFLIEGKFGRAKDAPDFSQPGAWEDRWQQWSVLVGDDERVAVVYLVNPPEVTPRRWQRVRMPARFFKIWREPQPDGSTRDFMVFVGHSAKALKITNGTTPGPGGAWPALMIALLAGLAVGLVLLRRAVSRSRTNGPERSRLVSVRAAAREVAEEEDDPDAPPLPKDPVEALAELERRRADAEASRD